MVIKNNFEKLNSNIDSIIINTKNNLKQIRDIETVLQEINSKYIICDNIQIDMVSYFGLIKNKSIIINNYKLTLDQVSLWQSHYFIWKQMVEENIQKLLILEDTCLFINDFNKKYSKLLKEYNNISFDILYLGYSNALIDYNKPLYLINKGLPKLTHSYILTLSGAKKLVKQLNSINCPFDELLGKLFSKKQLDGYRTSKLLTYQEHQTRDKRYENYLKSTNREICPMYYINLNKRKKRREQMEYEIKKNNLDIIRFSAIDGNAMERKNNYITKGRYGCWMSAYKLWEKVRDSETSILFEDDIIFCENFKEKLKNIFEEAEELDYDMLLLAHNWYKKSQKVPVTKNISKIGLFYGMQAYIITPKCAKYLCERFWDSTAWPKPKDVLIGEINVAKDINIYTTTENLVTLHECAKGSDTVRG